MQIIPKAEAHVHEKSSDINALIHISPDDLPLSGENSTIHFGIQYKGKNIDISDCDCKVVVKENGKELQSYKLTKYTGNEPSLFNADVPLVFPRSGAYEIVLSGKLLSAGDKEFTFTFAKRVEKSQKVAPEIPLVLAYSIVLEILLIIAVIILFKKRKRV